MTQKLTKQLLLSIAFILISFVLLLTWRLQNDRTSYLAVPAIAPIASTAPENQDDPVKALDAEPEQLVASTTLSLTASAQNSTPPETTATPPVVQEEGAPEGYIGFPPQCEVLWWNSLPEELPLRYEARLNQYQTETTVTSYNYYVNGILAQSGPTQELTYPVSKPGTYTVYAILETDKGTTLRSSLCEETTQVTADWF